MKDKDTTKEQLTKELAELHQRVAELEAAETERKRAEGDLRESEERYRGIFGMAPTSIILIDKDGQMIDVNPYHLTHIARGKIPKEDFVGKNIITHPTIVKAGLSETYKRMLEGEPFGQQDVYFPSLVTGGDGYFNVKGTPLLKDGEVIGAVVMHQDITKRVRAEEALQRKARQQEQLIETARHLTASLDVKEVLTRIGVGAKEILSAHGCAIYLLEENGKTLTPVVAIEPPYEEEIFSTPLDVEASFTGQAVKTLMSLDN